MSLPVITYDGRVGRWEPNAYGRLQRAALELYVENGFEQTTVADIAQRAGLTERTFFRHFSDKREVLFAGSDALRELLVSTVAAAPAEASPIEVVAAGLDALGALLGEHRDRSRERQRVIEASDELKERELIKLATLTLVLDEALGRRGVPEPTAGLAAEAGLAVFRVAFTQWIHDVGDVGLAERIRDCLRQMGDLVAGGHDAHLPESDPLERG
jgi:AcrR family transcriptional regulator